MCVGKKFIYGRWLEAIGDRIIKTDGVTNQEKLNRML